MGHLFTYLCNYMFHISPRLGSLRPFIGVSQREDGSAGSLEAGFTTYSSTEDGTDETYQTTYVGLIGRGDHVGDAVQNLMGNDVAERLVSEVTDEIEANHAGSPKQNANFHKNANKAAAKNSTKSIADAKTEAVNLAVTEEVATA